MKFLLLISALLLLEIHTLTDAAKLGKSNFRLRRDGTRGRLYGDSLLPNLRAAGLMNPSSIFQPRLNWFGNSYYDNSHLHGGGGVGPGLGPYPPPYPPMYEPEPLEVCEFYDSWWYGEYEECRPIY